MRSIEDMYIEHVFHEKPGRRPMFIGNDDEGNKYLCTKLCVSDSYIVAPIDNRAILQLIDDLITIREAYYINQKEVRTITADGNIEMPKSGSWPRGNEYLGDDAEKKGRYRAILLSEWNWRVRKKYEIDRNETLKAREEAKMRRPARKRTTNTTNTGKMSKTKR